MARPLPHSWALSPKEAKARSPTAEGCVLPDLLVVGECERHTSQPQRHPFSNDWQAIFACHPDPAGCLRHSYRTGLSCLAASGYLCLSTANICPQPPGIVEKLLPQYNRLVVWPTPPLLVQLTARPVRDRMRQTLSLCRRFS